MTVFNPQIVFVDSFSEAQRYFDWMNQRRPYIAIDTETEGLHWWEHRPRVIQIGDADTAFVLPWHLWGGLILESVLKFPGDIVMHNAKFDTMMFEHWTGIKLPRQRIHDTLVMAHILDPTRSVALKSLGEHHVDRRAATSQRVLTEAMAANNWDWDSVPIDLVPYWMYAGLDVILTSRLFDLMYPKVMAEAPRAYEMEMATVFALMDMERLGIAVDLDYTSEKRTIFRKYMADAEEWCIREWGVKPGSNQKVIQRLAADTGYEFTVLTDDGNLSLNREVLEDVIEATGHPLASVVLQRRRIEKITSAYLDNFFKLSYRGRVHPNFNPTQRDDDKKAKDKKGYGARTGRMSVAGPSLQNLPRKSNDNPLAITVRNCITATGDNTLIMCDFDQVEFRILAHLSHDPGLQAAFLEGDFFVNLTREMFNDPTIEKKDPRRQTTKNAGYAKIYGAGVPKFAQTAGITEEVAQAIMSRMDTLYPGMNQFTREVEYRAKARERSEGRAYVRSPLTGRKHYAEEDKHYALVNYLIQGTASEVLKMKDLELHRLGLSQYLVLNVHDEVILDVPRSEERDVTEAVTAVMNDRELFEVALTASVDKADRWGAKGG